MDSGLVRPNDMNMRLTPPILKGMIVMIRIHFLQSTIVLLLLKTNMTTSPPPPLISARDLLETQPMRWLKN
jgi:hypothetical protein